MTCPKCGGTPKPLGLRGRFYFGQCTTCGLEYQLQPTTEEPTFEEMAEWAEEGGCEAIDGCWVETDGHCRHGAPSWLLYLGAV
jgi:hypothetical protein